jgi:hypothetical protein
MDGDFGLELGDAAPGRPCPVTRLDQERTHECESRGKVITYATAEAVAQGVPSP